MADISVEKLYELCDVIDGAEKKSSCHEEYGKILSAVKSRGPNEKRLAAQLIARYFSCFPDLRDKSLDAIFELCEDDDVNIRKLVIKELPNLCRGDGPHVAKLADILVQLLQTEDHQEQQIVNASLFTVLKSHPKDTLSAIFGHILNVTEELIRDRAVKFLAYKTKLLPEDILTKQIEEYILEESKKVLQDVSGDEFIFFMHILSNLKHLQTVAGRQLLLSIVEDQADLEKPFQPDDPDRMDQLIQCMKQSIPFISKNVHGSKFVSYVLDNVFPVLDSIPAGGGRSPPPPSSENQVDSKKEVSGGGDDKQKSGKHENGAVHLPSTTTASTAAALLNNENQRVEILRLTAELSHWIGTNTLADSQQKIQTVFDRLMIVLPVLPSMGDSSTENALMNENSSDEPKIQFSEIECLIWMFHSLCKRFPEFLNAKDTKGAVKEEELKEFKKRLQYLARVIQVYAKKLNASLSGLKKEELKDEKNRLKLIALKTTSNINNAVKDLLHCPPTFSHTMLPSWKNHEARADDKKRESDAQNSNQAASKISRKGVEYYQPPSGKYSVKVDNFKNEFDSQEGFNRGRRGGRFFRGGNRGRW